MKYLPLLISFLLFSSLKAQQLNDITPKPVQVEDFKKSGAVLQQQTVIVYDDFFVQQAGYLQEQIKKQTAMELGLVQKKAVKQLA
ncbi:MAG: hypothetical protein ACOYLO_06600, partial [Ferruginibacter sp.]